MKRDWIKNGVRALCSIALVAAMGHAPVQAAAVLQVDANGILTGATGVSLGGSLFNVEFKDGSCQALFSGCDSTQDFMFPSQPLAYAASQALLDQVLENIDAAHMYDSNPTLTRGCGNMTQCLILTPFSPPGSSLHVAAAVNYGTEAFDSVGQLALPFYADLSEVPQYVYAVWKPMPTVEIEPVSRVPEPSTLLLFAGALGLLAWRQRPTARA